MSKEKRIIKESDVQEYETLNPLFNSLYQELKVLSKKKPELTLNESKVKMINTLLERIKELLKDERGAEFLYLLDNETLPQYSDVVLILSQYETNLSKFYSLYHGEHPIASKEYGWMTEEFLEKYPYEDDEG